MRPSRPARHGAHGAHDETPGTVLQTSPLTIACGEGTLEIDSGQSAEGVWSGGEHLAEELNLVEGMRLGKSAPVGVDRPRSVLILGVNGFIGSHLSEQLLGAGYEVYGMDLRASNVEHLLGRPGFHFLEGDISINREWVEYHVRKCDVVLPLVAIATPIEYVRNPLRVFELDFEQNLRIVRDCVKYNRRIIFPSTSEVYGMCGDEAFDEDHSSLVLGPINKQRWIYSCSKQLLDRVIWAYGVKENLDFTLFRPFNWIGPRLDTLDSARVGSSRAITQLILNLVEGTPIQLVDGGEQKRCFTDVTEGVDCLFRMIDDQDGRSTGQIVNIGNPDNEASIRELAEMIVARFDAASDAASSSRPSRAIASSRAAGTTARAIRTSSTAVPRSGTRSGSSTGRPRSPPGSRSTAPSTGSSTTTSRDGDRGRSGTRTTVTTA